jgi:hypothetical protein
MPCNSGIPPQESLRATSHLLTTAGALCLLMYRLTSSKTRFRRGSNPRPFACKANVITTTLRNPSSILNQLCAKQKLANTFLAPAHPLALVPPVDRAGRKVPARGSQQKVAPMLCTFQRDAPFTYSARVLLARLAPNRAPLSR